MSISSTIRAGAAYVEVTAETSKLQRNLTKAQAQLQSFGRSCTSVGKDLLMVSAAMALPLGMAVKSFAGFDDQMRLAKAVTRATASEFDSMTKVAAKLGRETSFTAKQVADGMVSLGRMGFSPKEVEQAIQPTLDLARATGTELGEAADIAANSMRIFGIEASKMSSVADVLTATANGSAQTLTDLFEALKMAGPQAKAAGENITDTSAAIGILANLGIKGSLAGTALRKSFSQFAKVKVQDQLKAVGVETVDANGNLRKMADIMADIGRVMNSLPTAERIAFAEDIFDIRGSLAGLSLGGNIKEFEEFIVKLQDIDGTARTTAKEMDAGLGGSFRMLLSAVEGAMNAIAKALEGTLQPLVDKLTAVTLAVIGWIEANSGLVTAFAVTVAGAAALGVALIAIGVAAKGVAAGITVAHTALKGFTFIQGVCIAQGSAIRNSILLIGQAFANYRNTAIPALVGTEKLCAAFGLASTAANRGRAAIILMSNAEAAAAAKSFLAAKWTAMTTALKGFSQTAVVAAIATKAQAAAELMASAKTALAARWIAMTEALKSLTLASVSATIATKAQAAAEIVAGAKNAVVSGWLAMTNALKGLTVASVAATIATKAQGAAEMAMAAKGAIVAGWLAMTKAIQGVTLATVAATVATYAHTAAEAICTAGTIALNNARKIAIASTALFTAVNLKAAVSITAVAVGNFLLAAAAKVAAVAMAVLSAVMTAVAAHPVAAALIALGLVLAGVVICLSRAGSYTAKLSDKMSELREKGDQLRKTDEVRMERLQQLASKQRLTNAEMAEAKKLARDLQAKYGDLGITISDNAARIVALDTAASRLGAVEPKVTNADDLEKVARLKDLSLRVNLNTEEQTEAAGLLEDLSVRYGDLGIEVDRVRGRMVALSDAAKRIQGVKLGVKIEADDLPKFDKLKTLSMELNLTVPQQGDAERLISELSAKYGDLGLTVNRTTGQIERLNTVAGAISDLTFKVRGSEDIEKLNRLKALSLEANLDVRGQEDAERLISELESKYGDLGMTVEQTGGKIRQVNEAVAHLGIIQVKADTGDLAKFDRIKELSLKATLDVGEQTEAQKLIAELSAQYGNLGVAVDAASGKIVKLNTVAANLKGAEFRVTGEADLGKLKELQNLSFKSTLTVEEQGRAGKLIAELEQQYGSLGVTVDKTSGRITALNDAASRITNIELGVKDTGDLDKLKRLKELSMSLRLDVSGQKEAETLISGLSRKYGDLGLEVDRTSGRIVRMNTLAGKLQDIRFKIQGDADLSKFDRLRELSAKVTLDADGQAEAERLVAELSQKYGDLGITVDKTATRITALNAEAARLKTLEVSVKGEEDIAKLQRLKALSLEVRLEVDRQNEADKLIGDLSKKYGDLGVTVDRTAGKITRLNSVAASLREISVKVTGAEDAGKVARLQELSAMPKLDSSGISEANTLIDQLKAKYGELGVGVDAATGRIVAMTDAQRQFAAAQQLIQAGNDPLKETHLAQLDRLQKLAAQEKLTADEQVEAQNIVNSLNGAYGSLGLGIDTITGKLNMAAGAQQKLNDAMKAATLAELDAEMAEVQANLKELGKENEALMSYWNHNLWSQISGRQAEAIGKIEANGDRAVAYQKKLGALRQRKRAVEQEKHGANTGTDGKPAPTTVENVEAERQRRQKASDDADSASKRVAEIDKQLARERKTELENEIDDIIALRDEYKQLIQTMLDFEKSKPEGEQDKKKIAELEAKLADADKVAEERIAKAKEKAAEKMKKDVADYQRRFADSEKDVQSRRAEEAQDRKLDETMKADPEAGRKMAQSLVAQYQQAAAAAKAQFEQELQAAQADGKIDDEERRKIDAAQEAYTRAESMVDKYSGKFQDAQDGAQKAADNSQVNGSFLASALDAMLGGGGTEAERTAKATESMAAQSKETNKLLKKIEHNAGGITYK